MSHFANVIISPAVDTASRKECGALLAGLRELKDVMVKVDLEEFVERGLSSGSNMLTSVFKMVSKRYILDV